MRLEVCLETANKKCKNLLSTTLVLPGDDSQQIPAIPASVAEAAGPCSPNQFLPGVIVADIFALGVPSRLGHRSSGVLASGDGDGKFLVQLDVV